MAKGLGSIPAWGTKIPQAMEPKKKKKKKVYLLQFLLPSISYLANKKKITEHLKGKKCGLKKQRKHQNQTQIWHGCWNYQARNLKQ